MKDIIITPQEDELYRPRVHFNADQGVCTIEGESYIEDINEFYDPLIDWLKEYTQIQHTTLIFNFKLTYYNTSSSKKIIEMLKVLKHFKQKNGVLSINWYYSKEDTDIIEDAEDFMIISGLQFNLKKIDHE
ncbi:MAG: DUF1987 domain-containing protein [Bacteroidota bacterium]|nr:DUF1987 domain-containing protein [Bacteroidota bacterium]